MKQLFIILYPIIFLATFALLSGRLVEDPPYPVSSVHVSVVFLLSVVAWYCLSISRVRRSYGFYAGAVGLGFLALANGLFPDLWLRWPEATLAGLALSQALAVSTRDLITRSSQLVGKTACLMTLASMLPLVLVVYTPWSTAAKPYIACAAAVLLTGGGLTAWKARQRKQTATGAVSLVFFTLLTGALLWACFTNFATVLHRRQQAEEVLLFALLLLAAAFIADQVNGEEQLRSGPHIDLDASLIDPLTSLANRRALEMYGPQLINQSYKAGRAVSVIMADIDHFKKMNDTHGHPAGDTVLRQTAMVLKAQVRKSDLVARYGGEEFIIILAGSPLAPALRLAEKMRSAVYSETVLHEALELKRTASFGVATAFPEEPTSLSELIKRADTNLYRAKHEGRNRVLADALPPDNF